MDIGGYFASMVASGALLLAIPMAMAAFLSPCILTLVPGYLGYALAAMGPGWVTSALTLVRRHVRIANVAGASMLIILGLLMVTGVWVRWIYQLQNLSGTFLTPIWHPRSPVFSPL